LNHVPLVDLVSDADFAASVNLGIRVPSPLRVIKIVDIALRNAPTNFASVNLPS